MSGSTVISIWKWRSIRVRDRKSTRLNSSHDQISYAVFCLKKKNIAVDDLVHHRGQPRMSPQLSGSCAATGRNQTLVIPKDDIWGGLLLVPAVENEERLPSR